MSSALFDCSWFFLRKWSARAFNRMSIIPPLNGISHQMNIEYITRFVNKSTVAINGHLLLYPDTLLGTDTNTVINNGLGVLSLSKTWWKLIFSNWLFFIFCIALKTWVLLKRNKQCLDNHFISKFQRSFASGLWVNTYLYLLAFWACKNLCSFIYEHTIKVK